MQFKHPELFWAFFLLLIPLFIHLFQLRRFQKTPFTNVKFLKKVISESRRSSTLKKWLLLFTRLLLLSALIVAFAQPFFAKKSALQEKEMVIYLDDSFSMQAKENTSSLLEKAVQDLIQTIPEDQYFTLFTNEKVFKDVTLKSVQNRLLQLSYSRKQLLLNAVYLKANTFFSKSKNSLKSLLLISDFQKNMFENQIDTLTNFEKHWVNLRPDELENVSIDSVYFNTSNTDNLELTTLISTNTDLKSTPVSLFNQDKLIAKTAANFTSNKTAEVRFTLPENEAIKGKIEIFDTGLSYDNQFFFNIDRKEKIKVLVIGDSDSSYLQRIFTSDEFGFKAAALNNLNYSDLNEQDLIVLNELEAIPNALSSNLDSFTENNGSLVIIPAEKIDINSYNRLLNRYQATEYLERISTKLDITTIAFSHPLYQNVFEKNVVNFQYPKVEQHYSLRTNAAPILSFQNQAPFLVGASGVYVFTASLSNTNTNFKNSPLIVPTLYKMGVNSLKLPALYFPLESNQSVDISTQLEKDRILKVGKATNEFIPRQKSFANKVSLYFNENPNEDGIYRVYDDKKEYANVSFNYSRTESKLDYIDISNSNTNTVNSSIASFFEQLHKTNEIDSVWKWFVILAVLLMLVELLIQKVFK